MSKIKRTIILISSLVLSLLMFFGCSEKEPTENTDISAEFSNKIVAMVVEKTKENGEIGDEIDTSDFVLDKIYYGAFSQPDANEIFVLCKILNLPHIGGLDRTAGIILTADTLEVVAYKEFGADQVVINCMDTTSGQKKILFTGTSTYQGISAQDMILFSVQGSEWVETPIEELNTLGEEIFCFTGDDTIFVASTDKVTSPDEIIAVLVWNPDTEQFELEESDTDETEELVLSTYQEWIQMYMDVWSVGPHTCSPYEKESKKEGYLIVEDDTIHSLADVKTLTEEICTPEGAQQSIYDYYQDVEELYLEEDGILYRKSVGIAGQLAGELLDVTVFEETQDYIHAQIKYRDELNYYIFTIELKLVNREGKWLVDFWEQEYE